MILYHITKRVLQANYKFNTCFLSTPESEIKSEMLPLQAFVSLTKINLVRQKCPSNVNMHGSFDMSNTQEDFFIGEGGGGGGGKTGRSGEGERRKEEGHGEVFVNIFS